MKIKQLEQSSFVAFVVCCWAEEEWEGLRVGWALPPSTWIGWAKGAKLGGATLGTVPKCTTAKATAAAAAAERAATPTAPAPASRARAEAEAPAGRCGPKAAPTDAPATEGVSATAAIEVSLAPARPRRHPETRWLLPRLWGRRRRIRPLDGTVWVGDFQAGVRDVVGPLFFAGLADVDGTVDALVAESQNVRGTAYGEARETREEASVGAMST